VSVTHLRIWPKFAGIVASNHSVGETRDTNDVAYRQVAQDLGIDGFSYLLLAVCSDTIVCHARSTIGPMALQLAFAIEVEVEDPMHEDHAPRSR